MTCAEGLAALPFRKMRSSCAASWATVRRLISLEIFNYLSILMVEKRGNVAVAPTMNFVSDYFLLTA
ncbi:MAG: hypothetical protein J6X24_09145, partial [Firmicutes bacterium]|nr:hypothetical protein [Bacillota bacterium]